MYDDVLIAFCWISARGFPFIPSPLNWLRDLFGISLVGNWLVGNSLRLILTEWDRGLNETGLVATITQFAYSKAKLCNFQVARLDCTQHKSVATHSVSALYRTITSEVSATVAILEFFGSTKKSC